MQTEINAESTALDVQILGVNGSGYESGNAETCAGRTIPWLQDTREENVWTKWGITYRDVVILDSLNKRVSVFNLTQNDLAVPAKYDSLKALILETAGQ
jgi:hypothetical protein